MDMTPTNLQTLNYAPPGTHTPKLPLSRKTLRLLGCLYITGAICLGFFAFVPVSSMIHGWADIVEVRILRPGFNGILSWILLPGLILPVVASIILLRRRR